MNAHQTSDDLTAGEWNWANDITLIVAANYDQGSRDEWRDYSGQQILLVMPDTAPRQRPKQKVDGVTGYGYLGGSGVVGLGCPIDGPQGERKGAGTGGFGVLGFGGSGDLNINAANSAGVGIHSTFDPGAGVFGVGGFWTGAQMAEREGARPERDEHGGAGVIGVAGGEHVPPGWPSFDQTRGVGVYGASALGPGVVAEGATNLTGTIMAPAPLNWGPPEVSQAGLWARGLQGVDARGLKTGVEATGGLIGVKATSTKDVKQVTTRTDKDFCGVVAEGLDAGIVATGQDGPGGIFASGEPEGRKVAQVRIEPQLMQVPTDQPQFTPNVFEPTKVSMLPRKGKAGEILVTLKTEADAPEPPDQRYATLWFCVLSGGYPGDQNPNAIWCQVLLGPQIKGEW